MIPKGLEAGQTYKYYGLTYRVTKVVGENYESERVGETSPSAPVEEPKPEPKEEVTQEAVGEPGDYAELPYAQLKKLCAERGLDATGKKSDLIARLEG